MTDTRLRTCRHLCSIQVIGSCGGPEKVALCVEKFGLDGAVDYKMCADREALVAALKEQAPDGIDMYFDNGAYHSCDTVRVTPRHQRARANLS